MPCTLTDRGCPTVTDGLDGELARLQDRGTGGMAPLAKSPTFTGWRRAAATFRSRLAEGSPQVTADSTEDRGARCVALVRTLADNIGLTAKHVEDAGLELTAGMTRPAESITYFNY